MGLFNKNNNCARKYAINVTNNHITDNKLRIRQVTRKLSFHSFIYNGNRNNKHFGD